MAKVCDIDASREDVRVVELGTRQPVVPEGQVGTTTEDLVEADLCGPCRSELKSSGLVLGLLTRYAAALPKSKRGAALTGLLPPGA